MYKKICPKCHANFLHYKSKDGLAYSIKNEVSCKQCRKVTSNKNDFIRKCPSCQCEIKHTNKYICSYSKRDKKLCFKCLNSGSNNAMYGKKHSSESKQKMSNAQRKIYESDKGEKLKIKLRNLYSNKTLEEIHGKEKAGKIARRYNACLYL